MWYSHRIISTQKSINRRIRNRRSKS
ncbi:MAG: hypothetical protein V8Q93_08210 [Blautia faecis]